MSRQSLVPSTPAAQTCCTAAPAPRLSALTPSQPIRFSPGTGLQVAPIAVETTSSCCGAAASASISTTGSPSYAHGMEETTKVKQRFDWRLFAKESWAVGSKLLVMFFGFAFIGYFLNGLIPAEWISAVFGAGNSYSVPLAATFGLPFYINTEASLPLVRAMLDNGMSQGAALAFLITGAGTSMGALAGALTIARWRIIALVVGVLWSGAILIGYLYDVVIRLGWV